jgi:hypothetical protein
MRLIIGLTGKAQSGKDTVAKMISEIYETTNVKFADTIKQMVAIVLGVDVELLEDSTYKNKMSHLGVTPRYLLQSLGTEWGRELISENIWVDATMDTIDYHTKGNIVISDVRFPNEVASVRSRGGIIIKIERPSQASEDAHTSENQNLDFDYLIINDGTIEDLKKKVEKTMRSATSDGLLINLLEDF